MKRFNRYPDSKRVTDKGMRKIVRLRRKLAGSYEDDRRPLSAVRSKLADVKWTAVSGRWTADITLLRHQPPVAVHGQYGGGIDGQTKLNILDETKAVHQPVVVRELRGKSDEICLLLAIHINRHT